MNTVSFNFSQKTQAAMARVNTAVANTLNSLVSSYNYIIPASIIIA